MIDNKENFAGFEQKLHGKDVKIPTNKSFIFTNDKGESFGNLFGTSRLKAVYEVWYWWVALIQFMLRYYERKGSPPIIVRYPPGKSRDGTENADSALSLGKSMMSE